MYARTKAGMLNEKFKVIAWVHHRHEWVSLWMLHSRTFQYIFFHFPNITFNYMELFLKLSETVRVELTVKDTRKLLMLIKMKLSLEIGALNGLGGTSFRSF